MIRKMLRDDQWERIEQLLPGKAGDPGCTAKDNRRFVEAVLWLMRTGSPRHAVFRGRKAARKTNSPFSTEKPPTPPFFSTIVRMLLVP